MTMKGDDLSTRLEAFAVATMEVAIDLPRSVTGRHVSGQLIRCGTSPGANYEEARAAESKADFVHKLGIALKELRESRYWLRLIARSTLLPPARVAPCAQEADELCRIVGRSISTCRSRD
jgi:four helix bundle protein